MIKVGSVQVPTSSDEMTIKQFEKVSSFLNDRSMIPVLRYKNAILSLGAIEEEVDDLTVVELATLCLPFAEFRKMNEEGYTRTFELEGRTYEAYKEGEEFKITVKEMTLIEKCLAEVGYKSDKVFCEIIAAIFKDTSLTNNEHFELAHVKTKAKRIRASELTIHPFINYIVYIVHELYEAAKISKMVEDGVPK